MGVNQGKGSPWLQVVNAGSALAILVGLVGIVYGSAVVFLDLEPDWGGIALPAGLGLVLLSLAVWLQLRPGDQLVLAAQDWHVERPDPHTVKVHGNFIAQNLNPTLEVTLAQVEPRLHLLGKGSTSAIHSQVQVWSRHPDTAARLDNYWQAYILSPQSETGLEVEIRIQGEDLHTLQSCWLELDYIQYGRQLRTRKTAHWIVPLEEPDPLHSPQWQDRNGTGVLPIRTHLLTATDDLAEVIRRYVDPWAEKGDYVAISESAVAIVEGNFRHPTSVKPGWLARRLCYFFPSKTSLSSAYGMQVLIDSSNAWRVFGAFLLGIAGKAVGIPGLFYQYAGEQSALIDDVTGTLPPYDQFLVLGPVQPQATVDQLLQQTGREVAIVDVNDLKGVKVLAASSGIALETLIRALRDNPAGNSAEQTPVVLIRPKKL